MTDPVHCTSNLPATHEAFPAFTAPSQMSMRLILIMCILLLNSTSQGGDRIWDGDQTEWNLNTAWDGGPFPTASDAAVWNASAFGDGNLQANVEAVGTAQALQLRVTGVSKNVSIRIHNNRLLTIAGGNGTKSIDMDSADFNLNIFGDGGNTGTFRQRLNIAGSNVVNWDVSDAGNLTINDSLARFEVADNAALTINVGSGRTVNIKERIRGVGVADTTAEIVKNGTGLLILGANNNYTGTTTVNDGTLRVTGNIDQSTLTANGGIVQGGGVFGDITITGTAVHAPGLSPGIDTVLGDYTLDGGTLEIELGGLTPGTGVGFHDQVDVTGGVFLTNDPLLDVVLFGTYELGDGESYVIIQNDSNDPVNGTFDGLAEGSVFSTGGNRYQISYLGGTGNDVVIVSIPTPEPTSLALVMVGLVACVGFRRGRRRSDT